MTLFFSKTEEGKFTYDLRKKGRMEKNWAELPADLLMRIAENYLNLPDYVALSGVCCSWRKGSLACNMAELKHRQVPWLMLTDGNLDTRRDGKIDNHTLYYDDLKYYEDDEDDVDKEEITGKSHEEEIIGEESHNLYERSLVDLSQSKYYNLKCPQGYGRVCWGSTYGWIVTHGLDHDMFMFNPLTNARLDLPSRLTFPRVWCNTNATLRSYFIHKAIVLKIPSHVHGYKETFLVVVLYDDMARVAFAKPGDKRWSEIQNSYWRQPYPLTLMASYATDILYHRDLDRLVLVNDVGNLAYCDLCDLEKEHPTFTWYECEVKYIRNELYTPEFDLDFLNHITYICMLGQDLLMVLKIRDLEKNCFELVREDEHDIDHYKTVNFKVYKFHFDDKSWEELQNLGDVALFVGNNTTMHVCATDVGCEPNCIYFTDDYRYGYLYTDDKLGGQDMGVFRMDNKTITCLDLNHNTRSSYCCPLWFIPIL